MNINEIKELIITMDKTSIQKLDIETKDAKISLSKSIETIISQPQAQIANIVSPQVEQVMSSKMDAAEVIEQNEEDFYIVKSPIVGVFYSSPSPDSQAFVKVGDKVSKGQVVCIVEAMKLMNEIQTEEDGEIVEILVNNEDVIEFGQPLMKVRR